MTTYKFQQVHRKHAALSEQECTMTNEQARAARLTTNTEAA